MPITTKPSEALKLALTVMARPEAPWTSYSAIASPRGHHRFTCNALDYLAEAEEITDEAKAQALDALWLNSDFGKSHHKSTRSGVWFYTLRASYAQGGEGETCEEIQARRVQAINLTMQQLEEKGQ